MDYYIINIFINYIIMDPSSTVAITIAILGLISGVLAHMRFHSRCHIGDKLEISITKDNNDDNKKNDLSSLSDSSEVTDL